MNEKERLLYVLRGDRVDRPPVICPGGMMSACVTEISDSVGGGHHASVNAMVSAAAKIHEVTGFENLGVPFCLTAEVEPLGAQVNLGDNTIEPRVVEYNKDSLQTIMTDYQVDIRQGRMGVVLAAIEKLRNDQLPVIGNVSGPISTATSVVDPLGFFKLLKRDPELAYRFLSFINEYLIRYALAMVDHGADVIAVSDPTATGEILGKHNFEQFALPFYQQMIGALHDRDIPVIIHICGNTRHIIDALNGLNVNALSFDSVVNMRDARAQLKTGLMGNVNTQLLHTGEPEKIVSITRHAINSGVDIVAPACGLSMATPVKNLRAMTEYVKKGNYQYG